MHTGDNKTDWIIELAEVAGKIYIKIFIIALILNILIIIFIHNYKKTEKRISLKGLQNKGTYEIKKAVIELPY